MNRTITFIWYRERIATQADLDAEAAYVAETGRSNYGEDLKLGELMDFEDEIKLPAIWAICNRCNGEGSHVNPNIDGHGISAEEWFNEWDEEEREMYLSGGYDVACEASCTNGKVLVPDEEACANEPLKSALKAYYEDKRETARQAREDTAILYMESGGTMGRRW